VETTHKRGSEATYVDRAGQNGLAHGQLLAGLGQVPIRMKKSFGHATVAPKRGLVVCIVNKKLAPCVKEESDPTNTLRDGSPSALTWPRHFNPLT
jgi:hypothetical protein